MRPGSDPGRAVVFAGPSLGWQAHGAAHVTIRPPARRGDLLRAVEAGYTAIGLIDGTFGEDGPSVSHKEILFALSQGVAVLGAASMGALRACECAEAGMVGRGRIFADYRDGRRWADSDVCIIHAPQELGYQPLTLALVEVDYLLAAQGHHLGPRLCARLSDEARRLHFKERTWTALRERSVKSDLDRHLLSQWFSRNWFSQKRRDARLLLRAIRQVTKPFNSYDVTLCLDRDMRVYAPTLRG